MSVEENKAVARRYWEEAFNAGNLERLDELCAPDYVGHRPVPGVPPTVEGEKQLLAMYRAAFPDVRGTIEDQIAEGDRVVSRLRFRGTHQGEFAGLPPTGTEATTTGIHIVRLKDGRIAEAWGEWDQLGLLQQLGAIPAAGQG